MVPGTAVVRTFVLLACTATSSLAQQPPRLHSSLLACTARQHSSTSLRYEGPHRLYYLRYDVSVAYIQQPLLQQYGGPVYPQFETTCAADC